MSIKIIPCDLEPRREILDLMKTCLGERGGIKKDAAFWNWKHINNSFGRSHAVCAHDEESKKIAGLRVLMRWSFEGPKGDTFQAVRAVDTVTHPDHQRKGIFSRLTMKAVDDLTAEGTHLIFNTPNSKSLPGYLKMGWTVIGKVPLYIRIMNPVKFLRRVIRRKDAFEGIPQWNEFFNEDIVTWHDIEDKYGTEMSAIVDQWEKKRHCSGYRTPRDMDYLRWRYGEHPSVKYGVSVFEQNGKPEGFVVLRPNYRYGLKEIVLDDMFLKSDLMSSGKSVIENVISSIYADYIISSFARGTVELEVVKRSRFLKVPVKGIILTGRQLNPVAFSPLSYDSWDLTLGDLEVF